MRIWGELATLSTSADWDFNRSISQLSGANFASCPHVGHCSDSGRFISLLTGNAKYFAQFQLDLRASDVELVKWCEIGEIVSFLAYVRQLISCALHVALLAKPNNEVLVMTECWFNSIELLELHSCQVNMQIDAVAIPKYQHRGS